MNQTTKFLIGGVMDGIWIGSLLLGLGWQHEGALNLAKFMTAIAIIAPLFVVFAKDITNVLNDLTPARLTRSTVCDFTAVLILAWYGQFGLASALFIVAILFLGRVLNERAKREQDA